MKKAIFTTSSDAGFFTVVLRLIESEDGLSLEVEAGSQFRPTLNMPPELAQKIGLELSQLNSTKISLRWRPAFLYRAWLNIAPKETGISVCSLFMMAITIFPFSGTSFRIETDKLVLLGKEILKATSQGT